MPPPPTSTLFPYTTLFRSRRASAIPSSNTFSDSSSGRLPLSSWPTSCSSRVSESSNLRSVIRFPRLRDAARSEEHTSELQSHHDLVCRLLLEKKKKKK